MGRGGVDPGWIEPQVEIDDSEWQAQDRESGPEPRATGRINCPDQPKEGEEGREE